MKRSTCGRTSRLRWKRGRWNLSRSISSFACFVRASLWVSSFLRATRNSASRATWPAATRSSYATSCSWWFWAILSCIIFATWCEMPRKSSRTDSLSISNSFINYFFVTHRSTSKRNQNIERTNRHPTTLYGNSLYRQPNLNYSYCCSPLARLNQNLRNYLIFYELAILTFTSNN